MNNSWVGWYTQHLNTPKLTEKFTHIFVLTRQYSWLVPQSRNGFSDEIVERFSTRSNAEDLNVRLIDRYFSEQRQSINYLDGNFTWWFDQKRWNTKEVSATRYLELLAQIRSVESTPGQRIQSAHAECEYHCATMPATAALLRLFSEYNIRLFAQPIDLIEPKFDIKLIEFVQYRSWLLSEAANCGIKID